MKKILLTGIRFYQRYLSPIKGGSTCKFYPTCSQYAKEAIEKYLVYYNQKRIKEKLGWMSPVEYRLSVLAA